MTAPLLVPVPVTSPGAPAGGPRHRAWRSGLVAATGLVVVALLAERSGGPAAAFRATVGADPRWLGAATVLGSGSYLCAALVQHGAVSRSVPLGRLVAVQVACAFTNRLLPVGLGGMATNVRGLRRAGIAHGPARLAVGVAAAAGLLTHVVTLGAALPYAVAARPRSLGLLPGHVAGPVLALALLAALGLLLAAPALARRLGRRLGVHGDRLRRLARSPGDLGLLVGGSFGITVCHATAFAAAVRAVGLAVPLPSVLALYVVAVALAGLVPTPGGVGGVDAALLLALGAAGAAAPAAAAAVLAFRLVTFWLPVLPGLAVLLWSVRRGWL